METEKSLRQEGNEAYTSKVDLRFLRHDQKEKDASKPDEEIRLTAAGKENAAGLADLESVEQAVAFGSPRKRSQETAGLQMAGNLDEITGTESLEELQDKLDQELGYGSKINVDRRLDFTIDEKSPYGAKAMEAFMGGTLLKFLVEESDALAEQLGDTENSTYSREAQGIAQIVEKYLTVAKNWEKIVTEKEKEDKVLTRLLGSHQSVPESFLAKVIEATKGVAARDEFVGALSNQGFGFSEGYDVEILTNGSEEPRIHIKYSKDREGAEPFVFDEEVSPEVIKEIAAPEELVAATA